MVELPHMSVTIPLTIKFMQESQAKGCPIVAYNPEFDISSCGKNEEEAKQLLEEAIDILLNGAKEDGVFEEILEEVGFTKKKTEYIAPKTSFSTFFYRFGSYA